MTDIKHFHIHVMLIYMLYQEHIEQQQYLQDQLFIQHLNKEDHLLGHDLQEIGVQHSHSVQHCQQDITV